MGGMYPGVCHVMSCVWQTKFLHSLVSGLVSMCCNLSSFEMSIPRNLMDGFLFASMSGSVFRCWANMG